MARVGVFICDCGVNIASTVDVPKVVEYAMTLQKVAIAKNTSICVLIRTKT